MKPEDEYERLLFGPLARCLHVWVTGVTMRRKNVATLFPWSNACTENDYVVEPLERHEEKARQKVRIEKAMDAVGIEPTTSRKFRRCEASALPTELRAHIDY